jgi:16S rRNA G527 N7-methylase RsmG
MLADVHRAHLERQRHVMNLVGPGDVAFHFEDCRLALTGLQPTGHWVDLGAGAGFPGLVLAALHPSLRVDLVESRRKRCVFLEHVVLEASEGARIRVLPVRAETLVPGSYDGVVARAFAAPAVVLDHAARLLRPGGTVVLFLQDDADPPTDPRFAVFHVERYAVDGRERRAVALRTKVD